VFHRGTATFDAIYTVKTDGTSLREIAPSSLNLNFDPGRWSPKKNEIAFSAHVPATNRGSIWVVHADGTGLRQLPIDSCGGASADPTTVGCFSPAWSPNGRKIVFGRLAGGQRDVYTAGVDGSNVRPGAGGPLDEESPDWGPHPLG
jgi:Tol biopolymer transport system component